MIRDISLSNFRNFKSKSLKLSPKTTVIIGPNASGKTNLLESLHFLSTGKSFKARIEAEVIRYDRDIARLKGWVKGVSGESTELEAIITKGQINIGKSHTEKIPKKRLLVNGVPKRMIDFAGNFKTVLFGPWDMDLVTESPSVRRKFLDMVLSQVDREYRRSILSYEKGLRQRNKVLWGIREGNTSRDRLMFWDQLLIKNGNYITRKRAEFIEYCNSGKFEYPKSSINYNLNYDSSTISESRLEQYKDEEIASANTLVGPHRDDFNFKKGERDLSAFGSRGEQRMGVLWLKSAELSYIESVVEERPTLLLDDIFSELDNDHRKLVLDIAEKQQTIITSVNGEFAKKLKNVEKIELES